MGPVPICVGGKDINTLRRENKSDTELIAQQNERFVQNKLSVKNIDEPWVGCKSARLESGDSIDGWNKGRRSRLESGGSIDGWRKGRRLNKREYRPHL